MLLNWIEEFSFSVQWLEVRICSQTYTDWMSALVCLYKGLINDIEEVLGMTIQNQTTSQEEKEITAAESEQISSHNPHRSTLN